MTTIHVVVECAAFAQLNADHLALGLLGCLTDRLGHFFGFTFAKTHTAFLVTNHNKCGETKALTTFYGFGNAVDRDQTVSEFGRFFALVTAVVVTAPVVISGHAGLLKLAGRCPVLTILVGICPRIIERSTR